MAEPPCRYKSGIVDQSSPQPSQLERGIEFFPGLNSAGKTFRMRYAGGYDALSTSTFPGDPAQFLRS